MEIIDSDADSDIGVYSEKWIRQELQWSEDKKRRNEKNLHSPCKKFSPINTIHSSNNLVSINLSSSSEDDSEIEEDIRVNFIQESTQVIRFPILPSAYFTSIFEQISKFRNVVEDRIELVMTPENSLVSKFDSLKSLKFNACNMFNVYIKDCGKLLLNSKGMGNIEVKCIAPDKTLKIYRMEENQPMDVLMSYCARDLQLNRNKFKLLFDGEVVKPSDTCSSLDIATLDLIEIHFIS